MSIDLRAELMRSMRLHDASHLTKLLTIPFKLARSRLIRHRAKKSDTVVPVQAKTFWGETLSLMLPESVSTTIYLYRAYECELTRVLLEHLAPGHVFFDVGTHFGYFTCLASRLVGPSGQVHSFEPTRSTFQMLSKNAGRKANVTLNNVAVYSSSATIPFNDYGVTLSAYNSVATARVGASTARELQPERYTVQAITLDDYQQKNQVKPAFIKIDAESAEYDILQGMDRILTEIKPTLSLEVGDMDVPGVASSSKVVAYLQSKGYQPFEARNGALKPHSQQERYTFDNLIFMAK